MRVLVSISRNLWRFLDDDSNVRILLGLVAIVSYLGAALLVWSTFILGGLNSNDAQRLIGTWTLSLGPIVAAVVGYYVGTTSREKSQKGMGLVALIVSIFFFGPTALAACVGAFKWLEVASVRQALELWAVFVGPITGLIYGFYFSAEHRNKISSNSSQQ